MTDALTRARDAFSSTHMSNMRIAILYGKSDKQFALQLKKLFRERGIEVWTKDNVLAGSFVSQAIPRALEEAHFILVLLSEQTANVSGDLQLYIRMALEATEYMPPSGIKVIPARIDECNVPENIDHLTKVDLFEEHGWKRLASAFIQEWQRRMEHNDWGDKRQLRSYWSSHSGDW
jgi:hypothetical protein